MLVAIDKQAYQRKLTVKLSIMTDSSSSNTHIFKLNASIIKHVLPSCTTAEHWAECKHTRTNTCTESKLYRLTIYYIKPSLL